LIMSDKIIKITNKISRTTNKITKIDECGMTKSQKVIDKI
jgi:hypothetical protein